MRGMLLDCKGQQAQHGLLHGDPAPQSAPPWSSTSAAPYDGSQLQHPATSMQAPYNATLPAAAAAAAYGSAYQAAEQQPKQPSVKGIVAAAKQRALEAMASGGAGVLPPQ